MNEKELKILQEHIESMVEVAWKLIEVDWDNSLLLREGSLQAALYFHLRNLLGGSFYKKNVRVFPELRVGQQKIDIAIVTINPKKTGGLTKQVEHRIALIELKYGTDAISKATDDMDKLEKISKEEYVRGYVAYIHEYSDKDTKKLGSSVYRFGNYASGQIGKSQSLR